MYVKQNAGNINVICVILTVHVGGKKMTVFEKMKEMKFDDMVLLLEIVTKDQFFTEYFCGKLCAGIQGCKEDDGICAVDFDDKIEYKAFLKSDYEILEEVLKSGKISF